MNNNNNNNNNNNAPLYKSDMPAVVYKGVGHTLMHINNNINNKQNKQPSLLPTISASTTPAAC
jgi:hypothetical protein